MTSSTRPLFWLSLWIAVCATGLLGGCVDDLSGRPYRCQTNEDCGGGYLCSRGVNLAYPDGTCVLDPTIHDTVSPPETVTPPDCADTCTGTCFNGACYLSVPGGAFEMGTPPDEPSRHHDETQHTVTISSPLYVKESEVTQSEWNRLMAENPSSASHADRPVDGVTWYDALAYCNALSRAEGLTPCYDESSCSGTPGTGDYQCSGALSPSLECEGFRLPTEAEWEYVARAGTTSALYNGDLVETQCGSDPNLRGIGWYCGNSSDVTHEVNQLGANAWGLYDTAGNVLEWVWDYYGDYSGDATDPTGPDTGTMRVYRGGSFSLLASSCRSGNRTEADPTVSGDHIGFRPVRKHD